MNTYFFKILCRQIGAIGVFEWEKHCVTAKNEKEAKELIRNKFQYIREINAIEFISSNYQGWTNSKTFLANVYINQEQIIYKKIVAIRKQRKITGSDLRQLWNTEKHEPCNSWSKGNINFQEIADRYNEQDFI